MTLTALPITEKTISKIIGRTIKSPILIGNLSSIGIHQQEFLEYFSPLFQGLAWDPYDARRLRVEFLKEIFEGDTEKIHSYFKDYHQGIIGLEAFEPWIKKLSTKQKIVFEQIQSWRRRSVAKFTIFEKESLIKIERKPVEQFTQKVAEGDFRSWPRLFQEAPAQHVEHHLFYELLHAFFLIIKELRPEIHKIHITSHFMSVRATQKMPGDNSPEGAHEDGADFIVSALVINRINISGGESQILEQLANGNKEIIFRRSLAPGEFVFQADTGEELIYGNDLWHHVTPFHLLDKNQTEAWRDIIGFDIVLEE